MARKGDRNTEPLYTHLVNATGDSISLVDAALVLAGIIDRAGFTEGTTRFGPIGGVRNDAPALGDVAEDTGAAARITKRRAFHVNVRKDDATGSELDLQGLLQSIIDNTSDLEVNTDALEAKMDTLVARFPAPTELVDAEANPTLTRIGSHLMAYDSSTNQWNRVLSRAGNDGLGNSRAVIVDGRLRGFDGAVWNRLRSSLANGLEVDVTRSALPSGAATEATLASILTSVDGLEAKLDAANASLDVIEAEDFAHEATLASLLTEIQDLSHEEDAIHTSAHKGIMALTVRKDTPVALASDGDYQPLVTDANGRLHVRPLHSFAADRQGATRREATHQGQAASFLHYTVVAGTLKCRLVINVRNTSTITAGIIHIRNGTTVAGSIVASLTIGTAVAGAVAPEKNLVLGSDAFPEHFTSGVFIELNAGTLVVDAHMVGVEE